LVGLLFRLLQNNDLEIYKSGVAASDEIPFPAGFHKASTDKSKHADHKEKESDK
jgi:hypothetical protein